MDEFPYILAAERRAALAAGTLVVVSPEVTIGIGEAAVEPPEAAVGIGVAVSRIVVGSVSVSISLGISIPLDNVDSAARVGVVAGSVDDGSGNMGGGVVDDGGGDGGVVDGGGGDGGVMETAVHHGGGVNSGLHLGGGLHHALHGSRVDSRDSVGGVGSIGVGMVEAIAQAAVQESRVGFSISVGCGSSVSSGKQADECERLHGAL